MIYYKQCLLKKKFDEDRSRITVSWIPEKFAAKGKIVKLQDRETKTWEDGWEVVLVGTVRKEQKEIVERSQDHKKQRKASDI